MTKIGSVAHTNGGTIISLAECMQCSSTNTNKCTVFSSALVGTFVCKRHCRLCWKSGDKVRGKHCEQPVWGD